MRAALRISRLKSLADPGPWIRTVPLKAGSAVIFTEALTHGTIPWTAEHERRALFCRYMPGHMAFVGRYREDGREHPGCAQTPARSVPRERMNPED